MRSSLARCSVVEIPTASEVLRTGCQPGPRELLPWADPYIARLLAKHRLQAALDDSLSYLRDDAQQAWQRQ